MDKNVEFSIASEVDARGLICPMPLLKAKQALSKRAVGDVVKIIATDRGAVRDFHTYAELTSHHLIGFEEEHDQFVFFIQKG